MPRRLIALLPSLVLFIGYVLACLAAAAFDARFALGVVAAIFIYEGREAQR